MPCKAGSTKTTDKSERNLSNGLSTLTTPERNYEFRLWRGVIGQAVRDIYTGAEKNRIEVAVWIGTNDFETVCDLAEIHSEDLKSQLMALLDLPISLAKKYGEMLHEKITS
jgi:hypothetical protein